MSTNIKFKATTVGGPVWVEGEIVHIKGFEEYTFARHQSLNISRSGFWTISEVSTGASIASSDCKNTLVNLATQRLTKKGKEAVAEVIQGTKKINPKYAIK